MQATHMQRLHAGLGRFVATRRGAVTIAAGAAGLAGVVLLVFVSQYKAQVQGGTVERSALVANRLIPKGTSGRAPARRLAPLRSQCSRTKRWVWTSRSRRSCAK